MTTIERPYRGARALIAMIWGWGACNLVMITYSMMFGDFLESPAANLWKWLYIQTPLTGAVIYFAWMTVFQPMDWVVPETSVLRTPVLAALCGVACAYLTVVVTVLVVSTFGANYFVWYAPLLVPFTEDVIIYTMGAIATGLTASLHVVLNHPRVTVSNMQTSRE